MRASGGIGYGAPGGNRTPDAGLRTASLYPLSYGGAVGPSYRGPYHRSMRPTPRIVLYERAGCHLCDEVRSLLDAELGAGRYERADIDTDDELVVRYGFRVPVVAVDGVDRLEAPVTEAEVRDLARRLRH